MWLLATSRISFVISFAAALVVSTWAGNATSDALARAVAKGQVKQVKELLKSGANVNALDSEGQTALGAAAAQGNVHLIKALLAGGANMELTDADGLTPLEVAIRKANLDASKVLLKEGANPNPNSTGSSSGWTPLWNAVGKGDLQLVKDLIEAGAHLDGPEFTGGDTPLRHAISSDDVEIAKVLVHAGADLNAVGYGGSGPLHQVAEQDKKDTFGKAIVDSAPKTSKGLQALGPFFYEAASHKMPNTVKALHAAGVDVNFQAESVNEGKTALHGAVVADDPVMVQDLLDMGADTNAKDESGQTPGFLAVRDSEVEVVKELLKADRHWAHKVDDGWEEPIDVATSPEIVALLPKEQSFFQLWVEIIREEAPFRWAFLFSILGSVPLTGFLVWVERSNERKGVGKTSASEPSSGAQQLAASAITGTSVLGLLLRFFEVVTATILPAWTFGYWFAPWLSALALTVIYVLPSGLIVGFKKALRHPALFVVSSPYSLVRDLKQSLRSGVPLAFFRCALILGIPLFIGFKSEKYLYNKRYEGPQINVEKLIPDKNYSSPVLCVIAPYGMDFEDDPSRQLFQCLPELLLYHVMLPICLLMGACCCGCCDGCLRLCSRCSGKAANEEAVDPHSAAEQIRELAGSFDRAREEASPEDPEVYKKVAELLETHKTGAGKLAAAPSIKNFWKTPYFDLAMMGLDVVSDVYTVQNMFLHHHNWFGAILLMILISSTAAEAIEGNTPSVLWQEAKESARVGFRTERFKAMQQHEATWEALPALAISVYGFWFNVSNWSQFAPAIFSILLSMRGLATFLHQKLDLELPDGQMVSVAPKEQGSTQEDKQTLLAAAAE